MFSECDEYAQYAYEDKIAETLSILTRRSRVLDCVSEKLPLIKGGTKALPKEFPHMVSTKFVKISTIPQNINNS